MTLVQPVDPVTLSRLELAGTWLEGLPPSVLDRLLVRSKLLGLRAGDFVFPASDPAPRVGLVLAGIVRSFMTAADGRQLTVRYVRRGAILGKYAALVGAHPPLARQSISDGIVLELNVEDFEACLDTELSVARALNLELSNRLEDVYAAIGDSAFGSIRQRLARHLLALATSSVHAPFHRVVLTQQQLADAIGSSREVVARELGRLRRDAMIRTESGFIELLDVDGLVSTLNSWQAESPY